ncbi:FadR/GntR family transcriptional regulator [Oceanibacterium hippocampi]|uniref:Putative L-lactate dehydrogenase operon regulatory protein n=1 Tax=Oceanibacterium hippocampi TaxID=745714 RepID=A0A1Y5TSC5_9PROT|nr:FCD domain-containing protein [Oceanibacterium hippocampi]SLN71264.1 Putative L-lactate dehydrogenase operon regulatory protein [Oceanibacterium hippocampi]
MTRSNAGAVLAGLRRLLDEDAPLPGARLPAERELAARFGCSRQTLRTALSVLEEAGEIWRHVGQGTFRGPRPRGHPVRENILVQATSPQQLMRARLMMEPPVAAEAARAASSADIGYLRGLVQAGQLARSRGECEQADARFHRGIAETAGNPVLLGLLDYLAGARRRAAWQQEWERTYRRVGASEFTGLHCEQHGIIVDAIVRRDPAGASEAMRIHLETIERVMLARP